MIRRRFDPFAVFREPGELVVAIDARRELRRRRSERPRFVAGRGDERFPIHIAVRRRILNDRRNDREANQIAGAVESDVRHAAAERRIVRFERAVGVVRTHR